MQKRKNQKGISLLEVLLSLTIIAIILVMAVRYFFIAENNNRVNTTREEIGSVIAGINAWKGRNPKYVAGQLSIYYLYNSGDLPFSNSLVTDGRLPPNSSSANLFDPWGKEITVQSSDTDATITAHLPDNNDCISLKNSYPAGQCDGNGTFTLTIS